MGDGSESADRPPRGTVPEVLRAFLRLGVTSFGGPIAHVGYFRREFVERRRWLTEGQFSQLLAISQFLPGPASSQLGFGIGLMRAGGLGAGAAFLAFTLPSALLLFAFSEATAFLTGPLALQALHGLKLAAVAVVAHGVIRMARTMTPDATRATIALLVMVLTLVLRAPWMQLVVIAIGALSGAILVRTPTKRAVGVLAVRYGRGTVALTTALFALGLLVAMAWPTRAPVLGSIFAAFFKAGAMVFGGGHVVLPLLEQSVVTPGWVSHEAFLAGYGAAQVIPGPMFSLAAFLGAQVPTGAAPALSALTATLSVFAPGFLLLIIVLPAWTRLTAMPRAMHAVAGVNAAVVGLLAAALIDPVSRAAIGGIADAAIALVAIGLLWDERRSSLWGAGWCVAAAIGLGMLR
jgi:chromate transporter